MRLFRSHVAICCLLVFALSPSVVLAWVPDDVSQNPAIRMPGTQPRTITDPAPTFPDPQPGSMSFELTGPAETEPNGCLGCHASQPPAVVTTGSPWIGSMMGQAARDPIFWATMTVAMQDSIWALGNADAGDLCLRCHFPEGWLAGRSGHNDPNDLNASSMSASDFDGVHCDACHMQFDPFFEDAENGTRELGADWDEAPAFLATFTTEVERTYVEDQNQAPFLEMFTGGMGGSPFFIDNGLLNFLPKYSTFTENGSGQMFMSDTPGTQNVLGHSAKRGSFINGLTDMIADHEGLYYSRYNKSKFFCSTCHDVSNPVFANLGLPGLTLTDQSGGTDLISEQYSANRFGHVERTFSEFMLSAYALPGGAATNPEYAAGDNSALIPGLVPVTHAAKCQDCHMADVDGGVPAAGANPRPTPEHPNSGSPLHDFQGGNLWMTRILASLDHVSTVATFDPENYRILTGGDVDMTDPAEPVISNPTANVPTHTLDVTQGVGLLANDYETGVALGEGADRAAYQLGLAATIKDAVWTPNTGILNFKLQNNTGHKLISGYPEGRRMFLNIIAYDPTDAVILEINPYDNAAGTLKGLTFPYTDPDVAPLPTPTALSATEQYDDALVYEMQQSSSLTEESKTFHFVLGTSRKKDNRIPPKGFNIAGASDRLIEPAWNGIVAPDYFTPEEYAGGYDEVSVFLPLEAARVEINLYYQGTSREYIEFLRDEINGSGNLTLYGPDNSGDPRPTYATTNMLNPDTDNAYLIQSDPFFAGLKGWGDTIWALWKHNSGLGPLQPTTIAEGLTPFLMTNGSAMEGPPLGDGLIYTPDGGETLASKDVYSIRWVPYPGLKKFKLQYSCNNGKSWKKIALVKNAITATETTYDWLVPEVKKPQDQCFVKVLAINKKGKVVNRDLSDAPFAINPAIEFNNLPGSQLILGTQEMVNWTLNTMNPNVATIDLQYRKKSGAKWLNIATDLPKTTTSHLWTVPGTKNKKKASLRLQTRKANGKKMSKATLPVQLIATPTR